MRPFFMILGLSSLAASFAAMATLIDVGAARQPPAALADGVSPAGPVLDIGEMQAVAFRVLLHRLSLPVPTADGDGR